MLLGLDLFLILRLKDSGGPSHLRGYVCINVAVTAMCQAHQQHGPTGSAPASACLILPPTSCPDF